jgi:hypothetical protein
MFTAIKLFFGTPLGKDLIVGFALLLLVTAIYSAGHHTGYSSGHKDGVTDEVAVQKPIVDALQLKVDTLTKKINDDTAARNDRLHELEGQVSEQAIATAQAETAKETQRNTVIDQYIKNTAPPQTATCALDEKTVGAINNLIKTQGEPK